MFLILLIAAVAILSGSGSKAMETAPALRFDEFGNLIPVPELGDAGFDKSVFGGGFDLAGFKAGLGTAGAPSNGVPSWDPQPTDDFLNPCDESRILPSGRPRVTTLIPISDSGLYYNDDRDICVGAPCDTSQQDGEGSARPYTYFDEVLYQLHLSRGMAGAEAHRKSIRSLGCAGWPQGTWRTMYAGKEEHSCPHVLDEMTVTHGAHTMRCRYGYWKEEEGE